MTRRREAALFMAVAVVLCACAFAGHLSGSFVWDDAFIVRDNPSLHSWHGLWLNFTKDTWLAAGNHAGQYYRPLLMANLWLQAQLGSESVFAFRMGNVLLHLAVALLLLRLLGRFAISAPIALAATWLFLIHPAVTEPVMFIVARQEQLGTIFSLAAILVWPAPRAPGTLWRCLLASLFTLCAFLSKEAYLVTPLLIALAQVIWHRASLEPGTWRRRAAWLLLPIATLAVAIALREKLGLMSGGLLRDHSLGWQLKTGATLLAHYGALIATLSNGLTFARYHELSALSAACELAGFVALCGGLFWAWYRRNLLPLAGGWLGLVWFAAALAPVIFVVPTLGTYQNRYAYFPLVGATLSLASAAELVRLPVGRVLGKLGAVQKLLALAAVGVLVLTAASTRLEASAWQSNISLAQTDLIADPNNGYALNHYAHALREQGGCAASIPLYARAASLEPNFARAWINVAGCLVELGRYEEAVAPARHALALTPTVPASHYHLGVALYGSGQREEGLQELHRALALDPDHRQTREVLAKLADFPASPKSRSE